MSLSYLLKVECLKGEIDICSSIQIRLKKRNLMDQLKEREIEKFYLYLSLLNYIIIICVPVCLEKD